MLAVVAASCELATTHIWYGYIVPEASHLNVAIDARSGRVLVAEHKDISFCTSAIHATSCRTPVFNKCTISGHLISGRLIEMFQVIYLLW